MRKYEVLGMGQNADRWNGNVGGVLAANACIMPILFFNLNFFACFSLSLAKYSSLCTINFSETKADPSGTN